MIFEQLFFNRLLRIHTIIVIGMKKKIIIIIINTQTLFHRDYDQLYCYIIYRLIQMSIFPMKFNVNPDDNNNNNKNKKIIIKMRRK